VSERAKSTVDIESFLRKAAGSETVVQYKKKKVIYSQGDRADKVFYLLRGRVKVTVVSRRGSEAVIGILGPGDFLGESCLNGQTFRMSTTTALEPVTIIPIQKKQIVKLLRDEPAFSHYFLAYVLARNTRFEEDLVDQLFNSSEKRLARALLLLAHYGKEGKRLTLLPRISQETLAEMIGTTRGRVSFFMNKFRKLGFIDYNGGMKVNSSLLNIILHD
jgi:CRP/FNR family cyclic AMP-dependent transcriptional regulator